MASFFLGEPNPNPVRDLRAESVELPEQRTEPLQIGRQSVFVVMGLPSGPRLLALLARAADAAGEPDRDVLPAASPDQSTSQSGDLAVDSPGVRGVLR